MQSFFCLFVFKDNATESNHNVVLIAVSVIALLVSNTK